MVVRERGPWGAKPGFPRCYTYGFLYERSRFFNVATNLRVSKNAIRAKLNMSLVWMAFSWSTIFIFIFWTLLFARGTGSKFLTPFLLHSCTPCLSFKIQVKIPLSVKSSLTPPPPRPVLKWFLFSPVRVAPLHPSTRESARWRVTAYCRAPPQTASNSPSTGPSPWCSINTNTSFFPPTLLSNHQLLHALPSPFSSLVTASSVRTALP